MKKLISLLLAIVLCLGLAACGSTGNADQDYVLSLMERGDYDMAIAVLERLRDDATGTGNLDAPAQTDEDAPAQPDEDAPAQTGTAVPSELTSQQQLVVDTVKQFMTDKGDAMVREYEERLGKNARELVVTNAMEYWLGNCIGDGSNSHCLLINLSMDIYDGFGFDEGVRLLLDMDSQKVYNSAEMDWSPLDTGMPTNIEEFNCFLLNAFLSYVLFSHEHVWADMEIREELSDSDIAAINEALK